tara:strand:+ start:191 stop:928 length:738 start_codon:yes stop_codon:yes gene_type:complete
MIKFFRKIRQNLLMENKTGKYFKYAIGEIILVVVGILIALSINNWNSKHQLKQQEQLVLKELNNEFKSNKILLDTAVFYHQRNFNSAQWIHNKLPIILKTIDIDSLSYHLFYMGWTFTYDPYTGVTNNVLNNASLELISDDELRQLLVSWNDILTDYQEEEIRAFNNYQNHLKPFEKKHFHFSFNYLDWLKNPKVDLNILETLEFDNYVEDRYNDCNEILNNVSDELTHVYSSISRIIELTELEY